jgi:hypothetical protein
MGRKLDTYYHGWCTEVGEARQLGTLDGYAANIDNIIDRTALSL